MITRKLANTNNVILGAIEKFLEVLEVQSHTSNTPFLGIIGRPSDHQLWKMPHRSFFPFCRSLIISNVHDIFKRPSPRYLTSFRIVFSILQHIFGRLGAPKIQNFTSFSLNQLNGLTTWWVPPKKSKKFVLFGGYPHLMGPLRLLKKAQKLPVAHVWGRRIRSMRL